jgi:hypothetical protein
MYSGFSGRMREPVLPGKFQGSSYDHNDLSPSIPPYMMKQTKSQRNPISAKLKSDIAMVTQGASSIIDHAIGHINTLTGMFRQGITVKGYSIQPPAMDYRDNYWIPPYEIPVEPNYYPGYNIVTGTPRNDYYNVAGSYPAIMM